MYISIRNVLKIKFFSGIFPPFRGINPLLPVYYLTCLLIDLSYIRSIYAQTQGSSLPLPMEQVPRSDEGVPQALIPTFSASSHDMSVIAEQTICLDDIEPLTDLDSSLLNQGISGKDSYCWLSLQCFLNTNFVEPFMVTVALVFFMANWHNLVKFDLTEIV